jgi:hypothetical protein
MALTSPGVEVNVIDESFYTPAAPGTVPMIFVASAQNKTNGSGTGIAPGTLAANAGKPYLLTSQRELVDTFGDPVFYTDANNNPINGSELNEYGLQAAYSLLGVSSRAYITRADIDLTALQPQAEEPGANPDNGTNWLDTQITRWGIFEWNSEPSNVPGGQTFTIQTPIVITDETNLVGNDPTGAPKSSVGAIGQYAVRATTTRVMYFYKNANGTWVQVGNTAWMKSIPFISGESINSQTLGSDTDTMQMQFGVSGPVVILTEINAGSVQDHVDLINDPTDGFAQYGVTATLTNNRIVMYNDGTTADSVALSGTLNSTTKLNLLSGTYRAPATQISAHTNVPRFKTNDNNRPTGSVWIKTTEPNLGSRWRYFRWNSDVNLFTAIDAPLYETAAQAMYSLDRAGGGLNLAGGETFVRYNSEARVPAQADFRIYSRSTIGPTTIVSAPITVSMNLGSTALLVTIYETQVGQQAISAGQTVSVPVTGTSSDDADVIAGAINDAGFMHVVASVDNQDRVVITHTQGGDIRFDDTDGLMGDIGFTTVGVSPTKNLYASQGDNIGDLIASNWIEADVIAQQDPPQNLASDGELWFNSIVDEADIMVHDGNTWVGYRNEFGTTNITGPIVSASEPTLQSDGVTPLVEGDLWIDTSDIENYPTIYRYNELAKRFSLVDKSDQTTDNGVLFADARWNTSGMNSDIAGTIQALLSSDHLDPDAPDPALYPRGMLLFNLRRSGFNVKRFERNYINVNDDNIRAADEAMADYYPHRWVTESRNQADGSGSFGSAAQRVVVVQALQAMVNSNDAIRDDESRLFNVMATPNYPELIGEMVTLNYDRGLSAFVVGDSPMTLTPDATSLNEWGQNVRLAVEDNKNGLVSFDEYLGVYYPAGFTSDNAGNNIVVPPSHMALRTIALSDQVSYPWFAPAGTRRGGVTNATSSGYITSEGEFVSVSLNEGQRNTLYSNSINPITFLNGAGLVVFGQKTRARNASALDRINVARLVIYLRSQLNRLAKPYLFEPNDKITRDEIKGAVESLMLELVGQRALYDYIVVCDESNNTPARIDRNELYVDVAIEPVKAIEFIYIPLRLKNTGEIAGL